MPDELAEFAYEVHASWPRVSRMQRVVACVRSRAHRRHEHHPRSIERYKDRLILYGCGDLLTDYEGIGGNEEYRGELALMYLPEIDATTGRLVRLRMMPLRLSRMRLERARPDEVMWLADRLGCISRPFGADVIVTGEDGVLELAPDTEASAFAKRESRTVR